MILPQRRKTETKPDTYSKDRIFVTSFAFCVITYEPIEVQTFSAPQNDRQNLVFVKDIKVVVKKMTRNRRKVIGKPGDSLLCRLPSIQLSSLVYSFLYGLGCKKITTKSDNKSSLQPYHNCRYSSCYWNPCHCSNFIWSKHWRNCSFTFLLDFKYMHRGLD